MNLNNRKLAAAGVLAAILVGGGASVAAAAGGGSAPAPTAAVGAPAGQQQADGGTNDNLAGGPGDSVQSKDPGYVGSVPAPADNRADGTGTAGEERQETAALQSLATVSPSQAEQAALAVAPGTVAQTQLDNENGFVVYSVQIKAADGTVADVKVDAGNGRVLDQQAGGDSERAEGPDQQAGGDSERADGPDQPEGPGDAQN